MEQCVASQVSHVLRSTSRFPLSGQCLQCRQLHAVVLSLFTQRSFCQVHAAFPSLIAVVSVSAQPREVVAHAYVSTFGVRHQPEILAVSVATCSLAAHTVLFYAVLHTNAFLKHLQL